MSLPPGLFKSRVVIEPRRGVDEPPWVPVGIGGRDEGRLAALEDIEEIQLYMRRESKSARCRIFREDFLILIGVGYGGSRL